MAPVGGTIQKAKPNVPVKDKDDKTSLPCHLRLTTLNRFDCRVVIDLLRVHRLRGMPLLHFDDT